MNVKFKMVLTMLFLIPMLSMAFVTPITAFSEGGQIPINAHAFVWEDPASEGRVIMFVEVFEGCFDEAGEFIPHDMEWRYTVVNIDYDPLPGYTNGFSGFQILFPGPVPELYNQQSPTIGGPWEQNAYSGEWPPWGVEWDAPLPGVGIMPGEVGVFSFCTYERVDVVVESPNAGWAHTWGLPIPEPIIDADGSASRFSGVPGAVEVAVLDLLTTFPTGFYIEGLDWFDYDYSGTWTAGDDLHVEDPTTHPGAIRDGTHDDGLDPLVLDLDNSLDTTPGNEPVYVDLETGTIDPSVSLDPDPPGMDPALAFYDVSMNGFWDDGEDIVLDENLDGVFGEVMNTQIYIFYPNNAVPGTLLTELGIACSGGEEVCKKVKYLDEDGDGIIEVGEKVEFLIVIQVRNPTDEMWTDVVVKDRFGAEINITDDGGATMTTKGNSAKEFLAWNIGSLAAGEAVNIVLRGETDLNPGGHQEYTEAGSYEFNSGAVLKVRDSRGKQHSYETGSIYVTVAPSDG